jgi:DNA-binding NtrC family response regulator
MLVVMSPQGVLSHALPSEGTVTIGRGEECAIPLEDRKASRLHARLHVGSRCLLEDLGSTNGTRVGDRKLGAGETAELGTGEMINIGSTALILQLAADHAPPVRLWSQDAFAERFDEERAAATGRGDTFGLLCLTLEDEDVALETTSEHRARPDTQRAEIVEQAFRECLRPSDVVGSTAPGVFEILLPSAGEEAASVGALLRRHLRERDVEHTLRVAAFPKDGSTREALLGRGEAPAEEASEEFDESLAPTIARVAASEISVLVLGETGVGKEVLARAIHARSPRAARPLVCLNCAALSESLLESELFGHEKGAFTGAVQAKAGLLESASGGTVFLDELGEMPLSLQAKLLRVIEQREVMRVGSVRPRPIDVRFIAATNRDLEAEIEAGRFRRDLYFRLNGFSIEIPPLRERTGEIAKLARAFVEQACHRSHRTTVPALTPELLSVLERHRWPGNIRELRNIMERAVLLTSGDRITLESLPVQMMGRSSERPRAMPSPDRKAPPMATMAPSKAESVDPEETHQMAAPEMDAAINAVTDERERIVLALRACQGNQTKAAELLGISRRTLVSRLTEYDLPRPRRKDPGEEV